MKVGNALPTAPGPGFRLADQKFERVSLHATVRIAANDREEVERLRRDPLRNDPLGRSDPATRDRGLPIARPPIKVERLSLAPEGKVIYALR